MNKSLIGIQGGQGSFSEQAANVFIDSHSINNSKIEYLISSMAVLSAVESSDVEYGIFAMENAQGGVVIESIEALAEYRCKILDMFYITISQNLLVKKMTKMDQIDEIHSHQQALRQCKNYLADNFWTKPLVETDDTAEAARRLSEGKLSKNIGVIGSQYCADLYGLEILEKDIHDLKNNLTLFLAVKKIKE